jgi:hypothetical protein
MLWMFIRSFKYRKQLAGIAITQKILYSGHAESMRLE